MTCRRTDENGGNAAEIRYYPWGTERYTSGTTPTSYHFTGQRLESELGLYFYGARWFDPNRRIQPDSDVPESQGVQAYDRYAYVNNNPVNYTDPSGHMMTQCGADNEECGASQAQINYETQRYYYENCSSGYGGGCPDYAGAIIFTGLGLVTAGAAEPIVDAVGGTIAETVTTATSAACADGDCLNEIKVVKDTVQKGVTVLGRYPSYLEVAKDVGSAALNDPTMATMTTEEAWAINQAFLDAAVARGDYFYLASNWAKAEVGSFFARELNYLFSVYNYTIAPGRPWLIPPSH